MYRIEPAFWARKRVLVTGHTGFKGAWLCQLLHRLGALVTGYALPPPTDPSLYDLAKVDQLVDSVIGDIRDLDHVCSVVAESRPEVLIHMAAQSVVLDSYDNPVETYATNVMGTVNVLEAVRRAARPVVLVNVTTDKCYQNQRWMWGYRESDALGGRDPYSNSKACSELATQAFRHSYFPLDDFARHGVAIATARAGNVVGGGDWTPHQLVPTVVAAASAGSPVTLRNPGAVRPWQHVLDCLSGYLVLAQTLAAAPDTGSGEWNFGPAGDDVYTVADIAELLAAHWNVVPPWCTSANTVPNEELALRLDCSKAQQGLGWRCALTVPEALDWVAKWYLSTQGGIPAREATLVQIETYLSLPARRPSSAAC